MKAIKNLFIKVLKRLFLPIKQSLEESLYWRIDKKIWDTYKDIEKNNAWNRNYYQPRLYETNLEILFNQNKVNYYSGEKIRIVFLFQIPSVWASWESVWETVTKDERFDAKMLLFDREIHESSQLKGAREFLELKSIPFEQADNFSFTSYRPHVLVYQTPWENAFRPSYLKSDQMKKLGIRTVDICYGIPFTNSAPLVNKFPHLLLNTEPWRVYEISELKRMDHLLQSPQGAEHVVVTGHPKFDSFIHRNDYVISNVYKSKIKDRKVIFWTLHFFQSYGERVFVPILREYIDFAREINKYTDLFFLVRPHPKFYDTYIEMGYEEEIMELKKAIDSCENACFHTEYDYRNALLAADYVIGDRSALMVETCALQIPAIFMSNYFYGETMLPSVAPIFDSYYQGTTCHDIKIFIEIVVNKGIDYKKEERAEAMKACLPYLDGKCAQRIVDDMANSIYKESMSNNKEGVVK